MNDIRIPIPWSELTPSQRRWFHNNEQEYYAFIAECTRPITPEDIRSCLRMPDEWTPDEEKEYEESFYKKDGYNIWQVNESLDVAGKAIDIATRPASKPDPWEDMDKAIRCLHVAVHSDVMTDIQRLWDYLKKAEGK